MFTGLVEKVGTVAEIVDASGFRKIVVASERADNYASELGESIAINGCCLTVTAFDAEKMAFDISFESLDKTNLGQLKVGSRVNMERALRVGDRLGGHMVSGHVDGRGTVAAIDRKDGGWDVFIQLPRSLAAYIIPKGSITLDGVSLTVNELRDEEAACVIRLTLIPATIALTTFPYMAPGWPINVEVDLVGKYLERFASPYVQASRN
jgi:riboflavin synthase